MRDSRALRSRIGYMSQSFSLYGDLTVAENIELFAGLYGVTHERYRARRDWIVQMAGLEGRERAPTAELPLGFKQRLALGCAVLHEPAILFLDEPTSGVDPLARRRRWKLTDELAAAGTTVIVTTHYMEEAENCDRLALMNRGRLIALDTPEALKASLSLPIFEIQTDDAVGALAPLARAPGVVEVALFGRALHLTVEREGAEAEAQPALEAAGHAVLGIERVPPSLEDVFVALVRSSGGAVEG